MARCGVPGIDLPKKDPGYNINHRTEDCGCRLVRYGPPVNGWVYTGRCEQHKEAS